MFYSHQLLLTTTNVVAGISIFSGIGLLPIIGSIWYGVLLLNKLIKQLRF